MIQNPSYTIPATLQPYTLNLTGFENLSKFFQLIGYHVGHEFWVSQRKNITLLGRVEENNISIWSTYRDANDPDEKDRVIASDSLKTNGYEYLCNAAFRGDDITFKSPVMTKGIANKHYLYSNLLVTEIDNVPLNEQLERIARVTEISGIPPTAVVFSGGKSFHIYYRVSDQLNFNDRRNLGYWLALLFKGDVAMKNPTQATRLPGFIRQYPLKDANGNKTGEIETRFTNLLLGSNTVSTVEEFKAKMELAWEYQYPADPQRLERFESVRTMSKEQLAKIGVDSAYEIFNMSVEVIKEVFHKETIANCKPAYDSQSKNLTENPYEKILNIDCKDAFERLPLEERYNLDGLHALNPKKEGKDYGCSNRFSATNSSGTSLALFSSTGFYYDRSNAKGGTPIQFYMESWYNDRYLRGKQFCEFVKRLSGYLGVDFDGLLAKYRKPAYHAKAQEQIAAELNVSVEEVEAVLENQPQSVFLSEPSEDFTKSSAVTNRKKLFLMLGSEQDGKDFSEAVNACVITFRYFSSQVCNLIQTRYDEVGDKLKIIFIVKPGEVLKPIAMAAFSAVAKFCEEPKKKLLFPWYGQNKENSKGYLEVDVTHSQLLTFDKIEAIHNRILQIAANKAEIARLNQCSYTPDFQFNSRWIVERAENGQKNNIPELKPGIVTVLSAAMGTGKTEAMAKFVDGFTGNVCVLSNTNNLVRQTCKRLDAKLWVDEDYSKFNINTEKRIALCIHSLMKVSLDRFNGSVLYMDEVEDIFNELASGTTLSGNRGEIQAKLKAVVKRVLETNGRILVCEADITDATFSTIIENLEVPADKVEYIRNNYAGTHYEIEVNSGDKSGLENRVLECLRNGEKIVLPSDSQRFLEGLHKLVNDELPEKTVWRFDRETTELPEVKERIERIDEALLSEQPDLMLYSPSLNAGVSIKSKYFDRMLYYFCQLPERKLMQMLGRVREPIKREGLIEESVQGIGTRDLLVETLMEDWQKLASDALRFHKNDLSEIDKERMQDIAREAALNGADSDLSDYQRIANAIDGTDKESHQWILRAAEFRVRNNLSRYALRENMILRLKAHGHSVSSSEYIKVAEIKEKSKVIKEEIREIKATELATADTSGLDEYKATKIRKSHSATKADRNAATKFFLERAYPGLDLSPEFCLEMIERQNSKGLKAAKSYWLAKNLEAARNEELDSFRYVARNRLVAVQDVKLTGLKADLLHRSKIIEVLEGSSTYHSKMAEVLAVFDFAKLHSKEIKRTLGITITPKSRVFDIFKKLALAVGITFKRHSYPVIDGEQTYVYEIKQDFKYDFHQAVQQALEIKRIELQLQGITSAKEAVQQLSLEVLTEDMYYSANNSSKATTTYQAENVELLLEGQRCFEEVLEAVSNQSFESLEVIATKYSLEVRSKVFAEYLNDIQKAHLSKLFLMAARQGKIA